MARRTRLLIAAAALATAAIPAAVDAQTSERTTAIVSPPGGQPPADFSSDNAAFSQDNRNARLLAFDSSATNLVPGDTNGKRDVFVLTRGSGLGDLGGRLDRVSVSSTGEQGNGDSSVPSIDGDTRRAPHCIVFTSKSTNLARGDSSPDDDVFLRDLRTNRTELVSVGRTNASEAVVDGECEFVTFQSGNRVFVRDLEEDRTTQIARGVRPDQQTNGKGVAYQRGGQIYYQAFTRRFRSRRAGGPRVVRVGREVLVSATRTNRPGNGTSLNAAMDDLGYYVAFESTATNLCIDTCVGVSDDRNGATSDVFRRTINPRRAPTRDRMQMVSFSFSVNEQGNGASNNPKISGAGENVVFDSEATNLRESPGILVADANGPVRDIYYWNFPRGRQQGNVSRETRTPEPREQGTGQPYNGPSVRPAMSSRSNYIAFTTNATGVYGESNGPEISDVFMRFLGGE